MTDSLAKAVASSIENKIASDSLFHERLYDGVVTLDPSSVEDAWMRLAEDSWLVEVHDLPRLLHIAFLDTFKKRFLNYDK